MNREEERFTQELTILCKKDWKTATFLLEKRMYAPCFSYCRLCLERAY